MTTSRRLPALKVKLTKRVLGAIEEHHTTSLKTLFQEYYHPLPNGGPNRFWLTRLSPPLKKQVRLHLCVVRRGDLFDWTDEEVGTKILFMYNLINSDRLI